MSDSNRKLTDRQRLFVEHYLTCWNASEAARRAGYTGKANVVGPRLLANVSIAEAIGARVAEVAMSADEVLVRLARHARGSFEPFLFDGESEPGEAPRLDLSTEAARQHIDLIKQVETETATRTTDDGTVETVKTKVKLHDAQAALFRLGQHHGLFKNEVDGLLKVIDLSKLNDDQLQRMAAGEDLLSILLRPSAVESAGGIGAATAGEPEG